MLGKELVGGNRKGISRVSWEKYGNKKDGWEKIKSRAL